MVIQMGQVSVCGLCVRRRVRESDRERQEWMCVVGIRMTIQIIVFTVSVIFQLVACRPIHINLGVLASLMRNLNSFLALDMSGYVF